MRVLHINASPRGERSRSDNVADTFLTVLGKSYDTLQVEQLNVWEAALPDLGGGMIQGRYDLIHGKPVPPNMAKAWEDIQRHVDHFLSFDAYVISAPMWNFGLPYPLKHYIDVITQPGMAFTNDLDGNVAGHAAGKKAMLIAASAMPITPEGELAQFDFQLRYLESWLGFIGITNMRSLRVAPTYGPDEAVEQAMQSAHEQASVIAATF